MTYDPNTPSQPSYPPAPQGGAQGYGQPAGGPAPGYGNAPAYGTPGGYPPAAQDSNGIGLAGFIVALVSIVAMLFGLLGLVVCIVAIVLSAIGLSKANKGAPRRGLCLAGLVIGSITLVLDIVLTIVAVSIVT